MLYPVIGEPPSSGVDQIRCTTPGAVRPLCSRSILGGAGGAGSAGFGSYCASRRLPPDWRAMVSAAAQSLGPPLMHALVMQPSVKAATTRPNLSIATSLKSRRLRSLSVRLHPADPGVQHVVVP